MESRFLDPQSVAGPMFPQPILGWMTSRQRAFGFGPRAIPRSDDVSMILAEGDGHLMTIAPTGAGKGRGVLIPNLLTYAGPVIAVDPKGELYHVTADRRRRMGQQVVRVDPFRIAGESTDALNPLDVIDLPRADLECDSHWLATLLASGQRGTSEPFWDEAGTALNFGVLAHLATADGERRSLNTLRRMLHADDSVYDLAVLLDTCRGMNEAARQEIASFLQMPDVTRGGVQAVAASFLKPLASRKVADSLGPSTFPLSDVVAGRPLSVYLVIPPDKLDSHRALLKLWLGTLLKAVVGRVRRTDPPTLFLVDECARLGHFPLLEAAVTLCRGYGLRVWTFWQDLQQLRNSFPSAWQTLINNSAVVQTFGIATKAMADQWGKFLTHAPAELMNLDAADQVLLIHGQGEQVSRRCDYLCDALFRGLAQPNPFFARPAEAEIERRSPPAPDGVSLR